MNSTNNNNYYYSIYLSLFSLIAVLLILPTGYILSTKVRVAVSQTNNVEFDLLRNKQQDLLKLIMQSQQILASIEAQINEELLTIQEEEKQVQKVLEETESLRKENSKAIEVLSEDMKGRVAVLMKESIASFQQQKNREEGEKKKKEENKQQDEDAKPNNEGKRFVVKWHAGIEGVKTSERFRTLQEATVKFEAVGEVAKKLLQQSTNSVGATAWLVAREYGGQNWLDCMKNNPDPQEGDCARN